jgi:hypothetical protein
MPWQNASGEPRDVSSVAGMVVISTAKLQRARIREKFGPTGRRRADG